MQHFPPALETLVEHFARLPGIGKKSAQRLAFYVLSLSEEEAASFSSAILNAKSAIHCCPVCQNLTEGDGPCAICASPKREQGVICVGADPKDVVADHPLLPLGAGANGTGAVPLGQILADGAAVNGGFGV